MEIPTYIAFSFTQKKFYFISTLITPSMQTHEGIKDDKDDFIQSSQKINLLLHLE